MHGMTKCEKIICESRTSVKQVEKGLSCVCVCVCLMCAYLWLGCSRRDRVICHLRFHMSGIETDDKSMSCVSVCGFILGGFRAGDVMHESIFFSLFSRKPSSPLQTLTVC